MISLKKFKNYINFLKSYNDKLDNAEQAVLKINSDFVGVMGIAFPIIDRYVYMLTDLMELSECDPDLLWWWIYERNYGADDAHVTLGRVTYNLNTIEKLYNFIKLSIKNYKKNKGEKKNAC